MVERGEPEGTSGWALERKTEAGARMDAKLAVPNLAGRKNNCCTLALGANTGMYKS